jgi:hypothetical protein
MDLPDRVHALYTRHEIDRVQASKLEHHAPIYEEQKGFWIFGHNIRYYIDSIRIMDAENVDEHEWRTTKQINAGETTRHTVSTENSLEVKFSEGTEAAIKSELGLEASKFVKLQSKISSELKMKLEESRNQHASVKGEIVREFKLPDAPVDPNGLHIICRHFQEAPVNALVRAVIARRCSCCLTEQRVAINVHQPTGKVATRLMDFYSDGETRILETWG